MDRELLIEIGVEELPASWLPGLNRQIAERLEARLKEMRIAPLAPIESFSTPRRLAVRVGKIAERQEDLEETVTGPPVSAAIKDGQPTPAGLGFARKQGVEFDQITRLQTPKGEYLAYHRRQRGKSAVDALPELLTGFLRDLNFPKHMNWDARLDDGKGAFTFGRPIRWLLFLYGGRVVPYTIPRAEDASGTLVQDVESGALTYGHRFLATSGRAGRSIKVRSFDEYRAKLSEHFVVLDHADRRDRIGRELEKHARRLGGRAHLKEHAALIDEVADLVEYPAVVAGFFDRAFLELPEEVLTTTLVHHQHWFPVVDDAGKLKEAFLAVVNTQPQDERLIAKNAERVVAARLRDAKFFWDADRRTTLESRLDRLHTVVFHKQLGSYRDKTERIATLAAWIVKDAFGQGSEAVDAAKTAARLSKADLTTDMVFEFTELQGRMGGIYARAEGHPEQVWKAIYYHYLPIGVEADAPPSPAQLGTAAVTWAALSLADKVDSVVGLWSAGEKVSGSRDPYGLRRAGQGIVRTLVDLEHLAGLRDAPSIGALISQSGFDLDAESRSRLLTFFADRLRHLMELRGLSSEEVQAVTHDVTVVEHTRLSDVWRRASALQQMRNSAEFASLAALFKRASNLLSSIPDQGSIPRGLTAQGPMRMTDPGKFSGIDVLIFDETKRVAVEVKSLAERRDELGVARKIAELRPRIDTFFTEVMVLTDDRELRDHRVGVLADIVHLIRHRLGELSFIAPQTE